MVNFQRRVLTNCVTSFGSRGPIWILEEIMELPSLQGAACDFCHVNGEDTLHILRDCQYGSGLWNTMIKPQYTGDF